MVSVERCQCQPGFDCCCLHSEVSFLLETNFHTFFPKSTSPLFWKSLCNFLVPRNSPVEPCWWWDFFLFNAINFELVSRNHSYFNMLSRPFTKGAPWRHPRKEPPIVSHLSLNRTGLYLEAILQRKGRMAETRNINKLSWLQSVSSLSTGRQ